MDQKKVVAILGAGRVGQAVAYDLSRDYDVRVADRDGENLCRCVQRYGARIVFETDLEDRSTVAALAADSDIVVNALPGFMGYRTLEAIIEAGTDVVDVSFFAEDPFELGGHARERGVAAIVDCGVAPGLSNMIAGFWERRAAVDRFECFVGGLPLVPKKPWQYKTPFSPVDVVAEYTRPARYRRNGRLVTMPALSECEPLRCDYPLRAELEAFNTDGLRTLLTTTKIPNLREKTIRYRGHAAMLEELKRTGVFTGGDAPSLPEPILTAWRFEDGEADCTLLAVTLRDRAGKLIAAYSLLDTADAATGLSSMARTTGFVTAAIARLVLSGEYFCPGICAPEDIGREPRLYTKALRSLARHGIRLERKARIKPMERA